MIIVLILYIPIYFILIIVTFGLKTAKINSKKLDGVSKTLSIREHHFKQNLECKIFLTVIFHYLHSMICAVYGELLFKELRYRGLLSFLSFIFLSKLSLNINKKTQN